MIGATALCARGRVAAGSSGVRLRRSLLGLLALLGFLVAGHLSLADAAPPNDRFAYSIEVLGSIKPGEQHRLGRALEDAEEQRASVVILRLDTPGGSSEVTREMIRHIGAARMPVIVYVHPSGARAGSAGVFLMLAADVAAMAPGTNIGSATPVVPVIPENDRERDLVRTLEQKARSDAVAFARSLAEQHGRNPSLAEEMITKAANVPASVADRRGLIDLVATSERSLLRELDGFELAGPPKRTLRTAGLAIKRPAIDTPLEDSGGSGDGPSIGLILGLVVVAGLGVVGLQRGRSVWRRRKWLYRRWRGERRARQRPP